MSVRMLRIFIASQFLALLADRVASLAFVTLAERTAWRDAGTSSSILIAMQILPIILLSPVGGMLADRYSKKSIMWWADIGRLLVMLVFIALEFLRLHQFWTLAISVFLLGALTAIFNPAKKSMLPFLVPAKDLVRQSGVVSLSEICAMLFGLGLGTALLKFTAPEASLMINWFILLAGWLILSMLQVPVAASVSPAAPLAQTPRLHAISNWVATLSHIVQTPILKATFLSLTIPFYISAGVFLAGCNVWAAQHNAANAGSALGLLLLTLSFGAIAGVASQHFFGLMRLSERHQAAICLFAAAFAVAGCSAVALFTLIDWALYPAIAIAGIFVGLLYARTISLLQRYGMPSLLGRIFGVNEVISALCFVASVAIVGWFATHLGTGMIWLISAATLFMGGVLAIFLLQE